MLKVVVIEDEELVRRGIVMAVDWASVDCEVVGEASNGEAGLEEIRRLRPDIVVTDIRMPRMDGLEMLRRLREEGCGVSVILLTAYSDFSYAQAALKLGAVDYLLKPFEAARFAEALERFEQRHRILNAMSGLDQKGIDTVFSTPGEAAAASRRDRLERKGLREEKYQALLDCLDAQGETALSAETLADRTGLSRVTVRRYLSELIEAHEVASSVDITTGPKPVMVYRRRGKGTK